MRIEIPENLKKLNALLKELYVTGGFTRNNLLKLPSADIDICSSLSVEEITKILNGTNFLCTNIYPRMGTLKIICKNSDENYEYTSFRKENYSGGGHTPEFVDFNADLIDDAKRRDFKINAIYYDIKNEKVIDPLGGLDDIKNKIISCTINPLEVFSFDGLRLLRLVRFAAELNFKIEDKTYEAAKIKSDNLKDISVERKTDEFLKIICSDKKYNLPNNYAHYYALKKLIDLNLLQYLIPQLLKGDKVKQRADFHKYDVLEHSLQVFKFSSPQIRLSALLHDIAKPYMLESTGKMAGHDKEGVRIADEILTKQIKIPGKFKKSVLTEIEAHMFDVDGLASEKKVRLYFLKYYDNLENIFLLKEADYLGCGLETKENEILAKWKEILQKMKGEKVPFKIKDLKINGTDLINLKIESEKIGETLNHLLRECAVNNIKNEKNALIRAALVFSNIKNNTKS